MSGTPRILFVADAGAKIGGGHVMRCLTLADALTEAAAACLFAATPATTAVLDSFARGPIERVALPDELSAGELAHTGADVAKAVGAEVIVADHYGFGPADDAKLAAACRRLLIIDDLRRRHAGGLVLDTSIGRTAADYPGLESLTGPTFALVRADFAAGRAESLDRRGRVAAPRRMLISLGLSDAGAITARVLQALPPVLAEIQIDVVMGDAAPSRRQVEAMAASDSRITIHIDARDMAGLMVAADIAIGAGGSSVWERCVLGLPGLTVIVADNQRENAQALAEAGATLAIAPPSGDFDQRLGAGIETLMAQPRLRASLSKAAAGLCDGLGATRVAAALLEGL